LPVGRADRTLLDVATDAREPTQLYLAAAIADATGILARPASIAVAHGRILAAGPPERVRRQVPAGESIDLGPVLVLPAMVNAHAHLDLTDLGPRPLDGSFIDWIEAVIARRPRDPVAIARSVQAGIRRSLDDGVGWLGDVAGSVDAIRTRVHSAPELRIPGISWLECFGLGDRAEPEARRALATLRRLREESALTGVDIELQPHAPYSAGRAVYEAAVLPDTARPSTHLAESPDELEFVRAAAGGFADLLRRMGKWDDSMSGSGLSPIVWLRDVLLRARWVLAHCNYTSDDDLAQLAQIQDVSVAYCPLASEYFGHRGHRYRELFAAGVNVCLGTDSILCQPPSEPQPFGILPQMRRLFGRDAVDPALLLKMATTNGARALGQPANAATLTPGAPARIIAVPFDVDDPSDPLTQVLSNQQLARPVGRWPTPFRG
jgi:cytosine/adenosine deaminase-related metal-dependent hydrolase